MNVGYVGGLFFIIGSAEKSSGFEAWIGMLLNAVGEEGVGKEGHGSNRRE